MPTPHVLDSVDREQATPSRYRIDSAERHQLPPRDGGLFNHLFEPRPAILVSHLPIDGGGGLAVLSAHFGRPQTNDDTLGRQVGTTRMLFDELQARRTPWLLGGDLNLLPPGQYPYLLAPLRAPYREDSELVILSGRFPMVPSLEEASGVDQVHQYTHFPNDPRVRGPDRTFGYLFHSLSLTRLDARVRRGDTLQISNHLPLAARFLLPH